jgi:hypothetical protein
MTSRLLLAAARIRHVMVCCAVLQAAQQLTGYTTQEYIDLFRGQPVTFK